MRPRNRAETKACRPQQRLKKKKREHVRKAAAGKEKGRVPLAEFSRTLPLTGRALQCLKWPMVHYNMELMKLYVELHVTEHV